MEEGTLNHIFLQENLLQRYKQDDDELYKEVITLTGSSHSLDVNKLIVTLMQYFEMKKIDRRELIIVKKFIPVKLIFQKFFKKKTYRILPNTPGLIYTNFERIGYLLGLCEGEVVMKAAKIYAESEPEIVKEYFDKLAVEDEICKRDHKVESQTVCILSSPTISGNIPVTHDEYLYEIQIISRYKKNMRRYHQVIATQLNCSIEVKNNDIELKILTHKFRR
jgi:hypothetical protein